MLLWYCISYYVYMKIAWFYRCWVVKKETLFLDWPILLSSVKIWWRWKSSTTDFMCMLNLIFLLVTFFDYFYSSLYIRAIEVRSYILFWYQYCAFIIYNLTNDCTIISNTVITNNMLEHVIHNYCVWYNCAIIGQIVNKKIRSYMFSHDCFLANLFVTGVSKFGNTKNGKGKYHW
jgi:hypothetical protein